MTLYEVHREERLPHQVHAQSIGLALHHDDISSLERGLGEWLQFLPGVRLDDDRIDIAASMLVASPHGRVLLDKGTAYLIPVLSDQGALCVTHSVCASWGVEARQLMNEVDAGATARHGREVWSVLPCGWSTAGTPDSNNYLSLTSPRGAAGGKQNSPTENASAINSH